MDTVRVRARWPMLNLAVGEQASLPRTALVQALVDRGFLELVDPAATQGTDDTHPATTTGAGTPTARRPRGGRAP